MSNKICRDKYFNYGSYLRSRGYDKEICNLVSSIENGSIQYGPLVPNGSCGLTIKGNTTIDPCNSDDGDLTVSGTITSQKGLTINSGGINQITNLSTNTFTGTAHYFNGGPVYFRDSQLFDLSVALLNESVVINTMDGFVGPALEIYHNNTAVGNISEIYLDDASAVNASGWQHHGAIFIDGDTHDSSNNPIQGATDQYGHMRILRGATIVNKTAGDGIDISSVYTRDISGTDRALNVYGGLYVSDFSSNIGKLDLSSNIVLQTTGDASMNGRLSVYDLSVVNQMTVGTSTITIDSSSVSTTINGRKRTMPGQATTISRVDDVSYSGLDKNGDYIAIKFIDSSAGIQTTFEEVYPPTIFSIDGTSKELIIDISNNQDAFKNSLNQIYFRLKLDGSGSILDDKTMVLFLHDRDEANKALGNVILDSRTVNDGTTIISNTGGMVVSYGPASIRIGDNFSGNEIQPKQYTPYLWVKSGSGPGTYTLIIKNGELCWKQENL